MSAKPPPPLPGWLIMLGSAFVAVHLLAIGVHVLAAPSGPWPTPMGPSTAVGPPFATRIDEVTARCYLQPFKMTSDYHFAGNRPDIQGIAFEVKLKDADGNVIDTLQFPSPRANAWVGQRQALLAQNLGDDQPAQPSGEVIPAPGKKMESMKIWDSTGPNHFVLRDVEMQLVPKMGANRPGEWSQILAQAYLRHLCRERGAASAELTRQHRQAIMPAVLFFPEPPPGTLDTVASTYEEYHREK